MVDELLMGLGLKWLVKQLMPSHFLVLLGVYYWWVTVGDPPRCLSLLRTAQ